MNTEKKQPKGTGILIVLTCIACVFSFFGIFVIPGIIAIIIIVIQAFLIKRYDASQKHQIDALEEKYRILEIHYNDLNTNTILETVNKLKQEENSLSLRIADKKNELNNLIQTMETEKQNALAEIEVEISKKKEQVEKETRKISKIRELFKSIKYTIDVFFQFEPSEVMLKIHPDDLDEIENLAPSVMLQLHTMNSKELRKVYRENDKQITKLLDQYSSRYNTKANRAIYSLMVIALRAELQNILTKLKYDKLDNAIAEIKETTQKYLKIAGDGNQSIVSTLTKFIGQIEYLFVNAAKIEYNYYVKKEKERQEQLALKEKMREEAAERKALEDERKKIEKEEAKYNSEIQKLKEQIESANQEEVDALKRRISELQSQLSDVALKKEDIVNLQNGKAGTVYVISNLGSFGEDVFKIGMTRRLDPQDRINELGSASVPFKFDVHSFIFSEDAVSLESKMHELLNNKRLNKVNLRKEFFKVSLNELEALVSSIDPTAEFNRTMLAQEYKASISAENNYSEDFSAEYIDDDELD